MSHEISADERRELLETAQRLEDLLRRRAAVSDAEADERALIARLDKALAQKGALKARNGDDPMAKQFLAAATLKFAIGAKAATAPHPRRQQLRRGRSESVS
jgi:hypothetical protein